MQTATESAARGKPLRIPFWLGLCLFLAIATFFLREEHQAHILGALPYVFLLLCPIIHLLMHRDHGSRHTVHGHEGHVHRREGGGAP